MTPKSKYFFLALGVMVTLTASGFSQSARTVMVQSNTGVLLYPTNFWSANAPEARVGLGLGSAATNAASSFQYSSATLSNLASNNAATLTNLRATNLVGVIPSSNLPTTSLTNIGGTLAISNGGSGSTTAGGARTNLGLGAANEVTFSAVTANVGLFGTPNIQLDNQGIIIFNGDDSIQIFTNRISFFEPIDFDSSAIAASTRTNLGLGATNDVQFNTVNVREIFYGTNKIIDIENNWLIYAGFGATFEWQNTANTTYVPFAFGGTNAVLNSAITRTNFGLGWSALTNTNTEGFNASLYGSGTNPVLVNTNGNVVSPTNFWQAAPIRTLVQDLTGITTTQTNNATNARSLYVYSLVTNVSGIVNTIVLPTNAATFNGDEVTVVHKGNTNTTTAVRQAGSTNNLITLNRFDESVKFIRELGQWDFYPNISFVEPIQFSGTNASVTAAASRTNLGLGAQNIVRFASVVIGDTNLSAESILEDDGINWSINRGTNLPEPIITLGYLTNSILSFLPVQFFSNSHAATTRTNLGIPWSGLTNTNPATFQGALFAATNAAPTNTTNVAAWIDLRVGTNTYKFPLYQ